MTRRPCKACGRNRAERFFSGPKGRTCSDCRKKARRAGSRARRLLKTYGLSKEDHDTLLAAQGGRCAICRGARVYNLDTDHDHKTGFVRGLLCKRCNRWLLPGCGDDVDVLHRAILYLLHPPAYRAIGRRKGNDDEAVSPDSPEGSSLQP